MCLHIRLLMYTISIYIANKIIRSRKHCVSNAINYENINKQNYFQYLYYSSCRNLGKAFRLIEYTCDLEKHSDRTSSCPS